jgi:hypothetical protein
MTITDIFLLWILPLLLFAALIYWIYQRVQKSKDAKRKP